jgi:hypothetical protein
MFPLTFDVLMKSTCHQDMSKNVKNFDTSLRCVDIINLFGDEHLKQPVVNEINLPTNFHGAQYL